MDYSDQYQQYHQYQQQQGEQQQQQQQSSDPSQIQAYDQSSQAYNAYYQQYHQYSYYHSQDYANSYAQQTHRQFQAEPTSIHPPGVPIPLESSTTAAQEHSHLQNQQNLYYSQGSVENQQVLNQNLAPMGGLNPAAAAAVAALSQLTQFAGNMDAAQRAMHPPIGQSPYRGGGRRGGRPFRGSGRGHFGHHFQRPNGSAPPFRGKGRGRSGGRHFQARDASSSSTNITSGAEGRAILLPPPSASGEVPAAPFQPPPRLAWCELCRVDCNTPEILEQHKNGKRHKKNLKTHEELQGLNKVISEHNSNRILNSELKSDSDKVEGFEENHPPSPHNILTSEVVTDDNRNDTEQQKDMTVEPESQPKDQFAGRGRGLKRKMRGGRGGKNIRTHDGLRRQVEPPKPKQVIPLICELCNVKCDSQIVFDTHLTGKKHLANLKRFHGHRALYGEAGLQALYPPNLNNGASTSVAPPVQQNLNDPQVLLAQLLTYVLSQAQAPAFPQVPPAAISALAPMAAGPAADQGTQSSQPMSEVGNQNHVLGEAKQPESARSESEAAEFANADSIKQP